MANTKDHVSYYYIPADPNFTFKQEWLESCIERSRQFSYELTNSLSKDPTQPFSIVGEWYDLEQQEQFTASELITHFDHDENDQLITYSATEIASMCEDVTGIKSDVVFNEIEKHLPKVGRLLIAYMLNGSAHHFHSQIRNDGGAGYRDSKTVTIVIPTKRVEDTVDLLNFEYQEFTDQESANINLPILQMLYSPYDIVQNTDNIVSVELPTMDQYLVVQFNSTKCLHWVNSGTRNQYLCIVAEI